MVITEKKGTVDGGTEDSSGSAGDTGSTGETTRTQTVIPVYPQRSRLWNRRNKNLGLRTQIKKQKEKKREHTPEGKTKGEWSSGTHSYEAGRRGCLSTLAERCPHTGKETKEKGKEW